MHEQITVTRKRIWDFYYTHLCDWARNHDVRIPCVPEHCQQSFHMFYIVMPSLENRQALIEHLKSRGILAVFHYLPLHLSKMGREFGGRPGQCPVTERVSDCLLRLPFYNDLSESEQSQVVEAVQQFDDWKAAPRSTAKGGA